MDTAQTAAPTPPPIEALRFASTFEFAAPPDGQGPRRIRGVAYSGELLSHPYWSSVIFDLATTEAPDRMPVLVDHDRAQRAGVAQLRITNDRIEIGDGFLLPNAAGTSVAADADAGFPWQLSVHIDPREIQILSAGESAEVNGRKVDGPATVFRNSLIREVSFTPTGVDSNTSAAVFSVGAPAPKETATMPDPIAPAAPATAPAPAADTPQAPAATAVQASTDADALAAITAERDTARAELETMKRNTRMSAIKALFADVGREFSDAAAAPYLSIDETAFAAVAADLRATKPKAPAALFSHQATTGVQADVTDPHKFAADIRAVQDKAAKDGRSINVLEAARLVRESASAA